MEVPTDIIVCVNYEVKERFTITNYFSCAKRQHGHSAVRILIDVRSFHVLLLDRIDEGEVKLGFGHMANDKKRSGVLTEVVAPDM